MKVAILSIYSFPYGMAATNRMAAYSQGLVANGVDVDVITIHPPDPPVASDNRLPDKGIFNGVRYIHPSGRYRNRSKLLRMLAMKSGFRFHYGAYKVARLLKHNAYDVVIMSFDEPYMLKKFAGMAKRYGAKTIFIFDEYPIPIRHQQKSDIPQWKKDAYRKVLSQVNGYISISEELSDYFNNFVQRPTDILSVIVDINKFGQRELERKKQISYVGNMELSKDNVDNIISAFSLIAGKYPDYSLHFYGCPNVKTLALLKKLSEDKGLASKVIFEGKVNSKDVPDIIASSKVMVSSQPDTLRAKGGFPTKLGEYVASATPTLLCDVGENRKYITEDDCYYVAPGNPHAYAEKLDYILSHYDEALDKARHGRQTIIDKYSHIAAGRKIKEFLLNL